MDITFLDLVFSPYLKNETSFPQWNYFAENDILLRINMTQTHLVNINISKLVIKIPYIMPHLLKVKISKMLKPKFQVLIALYIF